MKQIKVLRSVLNLADVELATIPDETTCRRIAREMNVIANEQLAEVLSNEEHLTLKYDGTTKAKQHWGEAQIATVGSTYTIGLSKMSGGAAAHYTSMLTSMISDCGKHH